MSANVQVISNNTKSEKVYTIAHENGFQNKSYVDDEQITTTEIEKYDYIESADKSKAALSKSSEISFNRADEWSGKYEFLMSCIATSVGLGNVWRFPFTAYENGGGAFLIPYLVVLFLIGKPFYYLEGLLGQFTSRSCSETWKMAPAMKGVGYGHVIGGFSVLTYYCVLMALTMYYFVASFQLELPWTYCRPEWGNECLDMSNATIKNVSKNALTSAELYFRKIVLNELDSIEEGIGKPSLYLLLCLLLSWLLIFGITFKGVKSSGKAAYFLAIFPYVVMITLFIRAVTLDGSADGILFFVTPKWEIIWKPQVWYAAITQCFFSLSVCVGPILSYSAHNNFRHSIDRDVLIATSLDTMTSFLAGCTIFGILGNLAHESGVEISKIVLGGSGLAFISYPGALSRFQVVPQLFSALFFFMMFVLGAGSAMALLNAASDVVKDSFPRVQQWQRVLGLCILGYCIGIVYITQGGQWFITLVDFYAGTFIPIFVAVFEMITVFWIYGLNNFLNDVEFMNGKRPEIYWRVCWVFITPCLMIFILVYTIVMFEWPMYSKKLFPDYAYNIGWTILFIGVGQIFVCIIYALIKYRRRSFFQTLKTAFSPTSNWGPKNIPTRIKWREFKNEKKSQQQNLSGLFFK